MLDSETKLRGGRTFSIHCHSFHGNAVSTGMSNDSRIPQVSVMIQTFAKCCRWNPAMIYPPGCFHPDTFDVLRRSQHRVNESEQLREGFPSDALAVPKVSPEVNREFSKQQTAEKMLQMPAESRVTVATSEFGMGTGGFLKPL